METSSGPDVTQRSKGWHGVRPGSYQWRSGLGNWKIKLIPNEPHPEICAQLTEFAPPGSVALSDVRRDRDARTFS